LTVFLLILRNKNSCLRFNKEFANIINNTKYMFIIKSRLAMIKIEFLGPINKEAIDLDITSLKELSDFMLQDSELKEWALNSAVAVNDKIVSNLDYPLKDGDKVSILPPVCGG